MLARRHRRRRHPLHPAARRPRTPRAGVQAAGCSLEQADDAVRNLAGLHAPRWDDDSLFDLAFLQRPTDDRCRFPVAARVFRDRRLRRALRDRARCGRRRDAARRGRRDGALAAEPAGAHRADPRRLPPRQPHVPAPRRGRRGRRLADALGRAAARDLAYFLATSVDVADGASPSATRRRATTPSRRAGVDGYPLDHCFDDYRLGQLQAPLITTIGCMYATAERTEDADHMFLAMARRSCAAIRDLDALDAVAAV